MSVRLTVADIRAAREKRQFTMLRVVYWDELGAEVAPGACPEPRHDVPTDPAEPRH